AKMVAFAGMSYTGMLENILKSAAARMAHLQEGEKKIQEIAESPDASE
ncbi:MAG: hypothetical protein JJE19_05095, partial [Methanosarcinales archaeon]|nr:hypothetical protein [Methanosarcinales archaeon]